MLITLTTDFGLGGRYVAQMKGVLYREAPNATIVDLSHTIPPQDIAAAARLLEESTRCWPKGSVHLAVVDPGVGTDRPIVALDARGQRFIGPDNGLFGWLEGHTDAIVTLDLARFDGDAVSNTFHGRDLMAPAAAQLAKGVKLEELGEPRDGLLVLPTANEPQPSDRGLNGEVIEVDHYGNLITNVRPDDLGDAPRDERLRIALGEHETFGLWRTYADQPPQTLLALVGSTDRLELAITSGSAAEMLSARVGDPVILDWGDASS